MTDHAACPPPPPLQPPGQPPSAEAAAAIRRLSCYDSLTGLPNRLLLREQLGLVLRLARRQGNPVAVLVCDVDHFRRIRNSLGHRQSELFLKTIAQRIHAALRNSDLLAGSAVPDLSRAVARMGGNEFAIVLSALSEPHDAQRVAQRLHEAASAQLDIGGNELFPTLSIGVALFPGDGDDPDSLLEHADLALGQAKDDGHDRTRFYSPAMDALASDRLALESQLRRAVVDEAFFPVYQPRVDGRTGALCGVEALVRWRHPLRGTVAPGEFIEVAEQSGLIVPIGNHMLEAACRQNLRWQAMGLPAVPIGVNVSAAQVARPDFVRTVARALDLSGMAPALLELEITESLLVKDAVGALRTFQTIKAMGVRIAIDDFGMGFSSMSYLRDFPFDVLKIDRSFVSDVPQQPRTAGVTCAIIDLTRRLGLDVVAEGVETEVQRRFLLDNGCHLMQGYLFCRPLAADALTAYWTRQLDSADGDGADERDAPLTDALKDAVARARASAPMPLDAA